MQADFSGTTRTNAVPIIFPNGPTITISINITDDNLVEGGEYFSVHIILGENISDLVLFAPTATINIVDNDGKCCMKVTHNYDTYLLSLTPPIIVVIVIPSDGIILSCL